MSEAASSSANSIPLDTLSLEQLQQLRQQEEARLQGLTQRYAQLRAAAARLSASTRAVTELERAAEDSPVLVPLTESLYVPGKVKPQNKLLVELGTGYYVEHDATQCQAFLDRKARLVQTNTDNLTQAITATQNNVQAIVSAMQGKILEIRAKQEGMRHQQQQMALMEGKN